MQVFSKHTYRSILTEYLKACEWLQNCGVAYSNSRFDEYKNILNDLTIAHETNAFESFSTDYIYIVNAVVEANELVRIFNGLNISNDIDYSQRLSEIAKGRPLRYEEGNNTRARNISFELLIAARFVEAGYNVIFYDNADVKVEYRGLELFVECKRLNSKNQAQKRISKGLKQLHRRYKTATNPLLAKGLLAVSIGRIINPDFDLLRAETSEELSRKAHLINNNFVDKYSKYLHKTKDRRTIGSIILLDTPGVIKEEKNLLTTIIEVGVDRSCESDSIDEKWLQDIANKVFMKKANLRR